jgi:DNA N-6-adenine-methyltransferase (Dam)
VNDEPGKLSDKWCTPAWVADALGPFDLDPCSNLRSKIISGQTYQLERGEDGLALPWTGSVYCNPPYSAVTPWARKLAAHDAPWCALVKLDPSTKWWAILMASGARHAGFRSRLKFEQPGKSLTANFASALVWRNWTPPAALAEELWMPTDEAVASAALVEMVAIIRSVGGHMWPEQQSALRRAEAVIARSTP